ncbi:hypothetical protein CASFOL_000359 [Castilleja foliolosa]|uniref:Uncharacterized protein n=1 Tax=Castilleja foliolosa TaxID=1961234 RepID=A0ABD3ENH0_9LAMI
MEMMDECGSEKVAAGEEAITHLIHQIVEVDGSPSYRIERKLGKGQVFVGCQINPSNPNERTSPGAVEVALKLEHSSNERCNYNGLPHEWQVYK